jgi:hypothetical protein
MLTQMQAISLQKVELLNKFIIFAFSFFFKKSKTKDWRIVWNEAVENQGLT